MINRLGVGNGVGSRGTRFHTHICESPRFSIFRLMSHTPTCHLDIHHTHAPGALDKRARDGLRAVGVSLGVLGLTAAAQTLIYLASGSVALLADLIHNIGDALTSVPIALAFLLRSQRAERFSGYGVVAAIAISGVVAGVTAVDKLLHPTTPTDLFALAAAGVIGVVGNAIAARVRSTAGRRLGSSALIADGSHARVDAMVSAGVVVTAIFVALGFPVADPIIALVITAVIGHITWEAWETVR